VTGFGADLGAKRVETCSKGLKTGFSDLVCKIKIIYLVNFRKII
jgi:hypothetical protein